MARWRRQAASADPRPGRPVAGAGLGLTIAKTFIEAHGQRIWVEDAPGGGARFCFTLPVAANVAEERELAEDSHSR
jgi:signal transduction histidine kinase